MYTQTSKAIRIICKRVEHSISNHVITINKKINQKINQKFIPHLKTSSFPTLKLHN